MLLYAGHSGSECVIGGAAVQSARPTYRWSCSLVSKGIPSPLVLVCQSGVLGLSPLYVKNQPTSGVVESGSFVQGLVVESHKPTTLAVQGGFRVTRDVIPTE